MLSKEAQLEPLPSLVAPSSLVQQSFTQEATLAQLQWPSGRVPGFLCNKLNFNAKDKDAESQYETSIVLPMKHKLSNLTDIGMLSSSEKRLNAGDLEFHSPICPTPGGIHKSSLQTDATGLFRLSSIVNVYPEPKRSLHVPCNVTSRLAARELKSIYGELHEKRRDREFVHSRFRQLHINFSYDLLTCITFVGDSHVAFGNDDGDIKICKFSEDGLETYDGHDHPLTLIQAFNSSDKQLLLSSSSNDVKLWDVSSLFGDSTFDLNDIHVFDGCESATVSNSGNVFAALSSEYTQCEILLYDIQTCQLASKFLDTSTTVRDELYSRIHFNCSDSMLLWNGALWDRRVSEPVHCFDLLTDFGGGGFHPAGNEVIINSEVLDLRKFSLLHSVPSLDKTTIKFNGRGDVIYAVLRRNIEDVLSAFDIPRVNHPLFPAFRVVDAVNYSDIATIPVDHCVLDVITEPTDSFLGLLTLLSDEIDEEEDEDEDTYSCVKIYEIGGRESLF